MMACQAETCVKGREREREREKEDDGMPGRDLCEGTKAGQHMSHDRNFYPVRSSVSVAAHRLHGME